MTASDTFFKKAEYVQSIAARGGGEANSLPGNALLNASGVAMLRALVNS